MYLIIEYYPYEGENIICIVDNIESAEEIRNFYLEYDKTADIDIVKIEPIHSINRGLFPYNVMFRKDGSVKVSPYRLNYLNEDNFPVVEDCRDSLLVMNKFIVSLWAENTAQAVVKAKKIIKEKYNVEV